MDRTGIIIPPPLLGILCIAFGFIADYIKPMPMFDSKGMIHIVSGIALIVIAACIIFMARKQFIAHGTHPSPFTPTSAIVVTGIYSMSRNPIYVAFLLVVIAFAFFTNSIWFLVSAVLLFFLLTFIVIKGEERFLKGKFGAEYDAYCKRVRRWI